MAYQRLSVFVLGAVTVSAGMSVGLAQQTSPDASAQSQGVLRMAKDIRKAIVMVPQYGVFDDISYGIKGDTVILTGKASRPVLKSDIENAVKRIEGVKNVDNRIEVLPVSNNDDRLRAAVYASIYRYGPLQRYTSNRGRAGARSSVARAAGGITNDPPIGYHAIHIIVENGNVMLTGVVDSDSDSAMAEMRANSVPGAFSVQNDLQVAGKPAS